MRTGGNLTFRATPRVVNTPTQLSPIDNLLSRLTHVVDRGAGRWMACCPSHEDRHPSLAIEDTADGAVLIHCFAACSPSEVLAAVDLGLSDLYVTNHTDSRDKSISPRWTVNDLFLALSHEIDVVLIAGNAIARGKTLSAVDISRLCDAARRVQQIKEICRVS